MKTTKNLPISRHAKKTSKHIPLLIFKTIGLCLTVLLLATVSLAGVVFYQISTDVKTIALPVGDQYTDQTPPEIGSFNGEVNMLVIASDTREGQDPATFGEVESVLADVIMLVHVSPDHKNVVVTSFPRDLMTDVPECVNPETGETFDSGFLQINSTLSRGGAGCTLATVSQMTGLNIPYVVMVDFNGVIEMSNALGGVEVCIAEPIEDDYTGTYLEPGNHVLQGLAATQFLRTRHGVGDGSDLSRISVQQVFLSALARKVKSDETLTNPVTLYGLARAATQNLSLSPNLTSLDTLVSLAKVFQDTDLSEIVFLRVPVGDSDEYPGRVVLDETPANSLFEYLRTNVPITVSGDNTGNGSTKFGDATPTETPAPVESSAPVETGVPVEPTTPEPVETNAPVQLEDNAVGQKASDVTCAG